LRAAVEGLLPDASAAERRRSGARAGLLDKATETAGSLVPHVFMVDPTEMLSHVLPRPWLARGVSAVFKRVVATALRLSNTRKLWLQFVDDVDETFDTFWRQFPKRNVILRDMSQRRSGGGTCATPRRISESRNS